MTDTLTPNPLIAPTPPASGTGITLLDDATVLHESITSGSWSDIGLSALGTGLDVAAAVTNPVATVVSYTLNYLIETVQPLKDALDWVAGDPTQIAAYAATWQNVAQAVGQGGECMDTSLEQDTANWTGKAATSYRDVATDTVDTIQAASTAADTVSKATALIGELVATVRTTIRNLVTQALGQIVQAALQAAAVFTIPLVVARVATQVASWMRQIAETVKKLTSSLAKLRPLMRRLGQLWSDIKQALAEAQAQSAAPRPPYRQAMARRRKEGDATNRGKPRRRKKRDSDDEEDPQAKGTPVDREAQQKAADDAWQEIQHRLGRALSDTDRNRWHDSISKEGWDFHKIVKEGVDMFTK